MQWQKWQKRRVHDLVNQTINFFKIKLRLKGISPFWTHRNSTVYPIGEHRKTWRLKSTNEMVEWLLIGAGRDTDWVCYPVLCGKPRMFSRRNCSSKRSTKTFKPAAIDVLDTERGCFCRAAKCNFIAFFCLQKTFASGICSSFLCRKLKLREDLRCSPCGKKTRVKGGPA